MFDEAYTLHPHEALLLAYHIVLGDGEWSRTKLEEYVARTRR